MPSTKTIACIIFMWYFSLLTSLAGLSAVVVTHDHTATANHAAEMAKWSEQLAKATQQVNRMNTLVRQTDQLISIIGNPQSVIDSVSTISGAVSQMDYIFQTETTHSLRKLVNSTESLNRSSTRFQKTVGDSVLVGGKPRKRNASLYGTYSLLERSKDNFDKIVEQDRKVQERELKRQKELNDALIAAQTEWERERIKAAIASSKAMQDTSTNAVLKAKAEYDSEKESFDLESKKQSLAAWEEHQMKEEYRMQNIKKSQDNYKEHMDNELYGTVHYENKIEFY